MLLQVEGYQSVSGKFVIIKLPVSQYIYPVGSDGLSITTFQTEEQVNNTKVLVETGECYWKQTMEEVQNVDALKPTEENHFFHRCWWDDTVGGYHDYTIDFHLEGARFAIYADDYDAEAVVQNNALGRLDLDGYDTTCDFED